MAKVKQFHNGPTVCKFLEAGCDAAGLLNHLTQNNRLFLQNAVHYAERNLEAKALPVLREALQKLGGGIKATQAPVSAKDYKARVSIKFGADVHPDVKNLVLGFANTHGGMLKAIDENSFEYGFSAEHAKYIMEKMTGTKGVTIGLVK